MATAAGISISASNPIQQSITTTDAAQSLVSVGAGISEVLVWCDDTTGSGDGRVVTVGASQAGAENTASQILRAGAALVVTPGMLAKSPWGAWSFSVCRENATNATFYFTPTVA